MWNFGWLGDPDLNLIVGENESVATHLGRAVFNGKFSDLELRNLEVPAGPYAGQPAQVLPAGYTAAVPLLTHAQAVYGPDAQPLLALPDSQADPDLVNDSGLIPQAGALATRPAGGGPSTFQLNFTSAGALEQNAGPLLNAAPVPLRIVGPDGTLNFDPTSYFFFQDNRRCYWVETQKTYWTGSFWSPTPPSDPGSAPFQVSYKFHPFYHPFTGLFWNQLAGGGFDLLYDPDLQQAPDTVDPSYTDVFSFRHGLPADPDRPVGPRGRRHHTDLGHLGGADVHHRHRQHLGSLPGLLRLHRLGDPAGHGGHRPRRHDLDRGARPAGNGTGRGCGPAPR